MIHRYGKSQHVLISYIILFNFSKHEKNKTKKCKLTLINKTSRKVYFCYSLHTIFVLSLFPITPPAPNKEGRSFGICEGRLIHCILKFQLQAPLHAVSDGSGGVGITVPAC